MSKVYMSFPISGYDIEERKAYAEKLKKSLSQFYDDVFNPLENGVPLDAPTSEHMKEDIKNLLTCDTILMCKGFELSRGCMIEYQIAIFCGLNIIYEEKEFKQ